MRKPTKMRERAYPRPAPGAPPAGARRSRRSDVRGERRQRIIPRAFRSPPFCGANAARREPSPVGRVCPQRAAGPCEHPTGAVRTPRPTTPPPERGVHAAETSVGNEKCRATQPFPVPRDCGSSPRSSTGRGRPERRDARALTACAPPRKAFCEIICFSFSSPPTIRPVAHKMSPRTHTPAVPQSRSPAVPQSRTLPHSPAR